MSSPLCSIGRQTLQVGVMSGIPAPLSSVAGQSLCPLTTGGNNDFYSEFAARHNPRIDLSLSVDEANEVSVGHWALL
jgi:hypothetical protein